MYRTIIFRTVLPLLLAAGVVAYLGLPYIDRLLTNWFQSDVELRARLVISSIEETLPALLATHDQPGLRKYASKITADQRLVGLLICGADGWTEFKTERVPGAVSCDSTAKLADGQSDVMRASWGSVLVSAFDEKPQGQAPYRVEIVNDLSFVDRRQDKARDFLITLACITLVIVALFLVLAAWLVIRRYANMLLRDISGRRFLDNAQSGSLSLPFLKQVHQVLREMEESQRLEIDYRENWTPQALQQVVREQLHSPQMLVVSNREPYSHEYGEHDSIQVQVPASGMVTALEPVMRACSGTWVAHGSGTADREVVDRNDRVKVPPEDPSYTLRRVWLSPPEEEGFYYGLSNEGLWPLCHLAYVRPAFRGEDWVAYQAVNRKFADVVLREAQSDDPVVLIQDYHFALLPGLLRARRSKSTIAMFWHIPWPNAETFGVCPWKHEMLSNLLMSDILGFHTLYHCQNFLATVDRFIECQIDHAHMTVTLQGHVCHVAAYPISIEWPPRWLVAVPDVTLSRRRVREHFHISEHVTLGLGVERWDFTKGVLERFLALELLLEQDPGMRGNVTLLQIAAPSRSKLPAYQALQQATLSEVERINERFATADWKPIVLITRHQPPEQVFELYRAADFCIVNSLHDGMNLVAKEFVAAREDEDGVLILSTFAGASRELVEALLVNPFDVAETAAAIRRAVDMPREQRRQRMQLMRRTVKENNVYRWAGRMLMDAARIRQRQALLTGEEELRLT
ncbi:MAG TPA: trehalose-6-phosphate synthase [Steroidobacteraceae bacterium]|jgi:trehalose 6-phosphate synthase/phosphatase|nr:trehalose-6-phosphate synthase [Steroidobacteraceae bacterium]